MGWGSIELKHGAPKNSFQRLSTGVHTFPTVDVIQRAAVFLQTSPARVVLAAAEELKLYDPEKDGRLSATMAETSEEVMWAFNDLVQAIRQQENTDS